MHIHDIKILYTAPQKCTVKYRKFRRNILKYKINYMICQFRDLE